MLLLIILNSYYIQSCENCKIAIDAETEKDMSIGTKLIPIMHLGPYRICIGFLLTRTNRRLRCFSSGELSGIENAQIFEKLVHHSTKYNKSEIYSHMSSLKIECNQA